MEGNSDLYQTLNTLLVRDAKETIQKLKPQVTESEIILDIGCGSGSVTNLLAATFEHTALYACDMDIKLIEHAVNHNTDESITYFVEDIGNVWENLHPLLQALEGKVSMVWSHFALTWTIEKLLAIKNIQRLLKKGGLYCFNIFHIRDIAEYLPDEEREAVHDNFVPITRLKQLNEWVHILTQRCLLDTEYTYIIKKFDFGDNQEFMKMMTVICMFYKDYLLLDNIEEEEKTVLMAKYNYLFLSTYAAPIEEPPKENIDGTETVFHYGVIRLSGISTVEPAEEEPEVIPEPQGCLRL